MKVHLINPSSVSFGTAVITPRWQYVLAAATPASFGDPLLVDELSLHSTPLRFIRATQLALEFTPRMRCGDMKLANWRASAEHLSSSAEFTPHFTRKRRSNSVALTRS